MIYVFAKELALVFCCCDVPPFLNEVLKSGVFMFGTPVGVFLFKGTFNTPSASRALISLDKSKSSICCIGVSGAGLEFELKLPALFV
jgi:hypothetical protein